MRTHALPVLPALLSLLLSPGCVIVMPDEGFGPGFGPDDDCPRECVNPADESCWHEPGSCGDGGADGDGGDDVDDDGLDAADEAALGTDASAADTDGDGTDDGAEVACDSDPLDPAICC